MVDKKIYQIFKQGSKTFFTSSLFFPAEVRDDIFKFYAFVRVADDMVDVVPPRLEAFLDFKQKYARALSGTSANDIIIDSFVEVMRRREIPASWIESFLAAMTADISKKNYNTLEELCTYIYGSAEVIGLVMTKLLGLPTESHQAAQLLGRGFQYINFIRDISEDIGLGRQYIPLEVLRPFGFENLTEATARANPQAFKNVIQQELERYREWQKQGEVGFSYFSRRTLLPIKTAADMYRYTAKVIESDPFIIFKTKVKPSKARIVKQLICNLV